MKNTIVSIEGENVDLSPGTVIIQTLKAFSVGDLTDRSVNFTNQLKAPRKTRNNDRIFGNSFDPASASLVPYRKKKSNIIQSGIEVVTDGIFSLDGVDERNYIFSIFSGAKGFFSTIQGKKLTDLDLSALNDSWAAADVAGYRTNTTGIVSPVLSYGNFAGIDVNTDTYLPSIYYHTIIDQIFADAGYDKSGAVFALDKYLKTIIPYSRKSFDYDKSFAIPYNFIGDQLTIQSFISPGSLYILFPTITKAPTAGTFGSGGGTYNGANIFTNSSASGIYGRYLAVIQAQPIGSPTPSDWVIEIVRNQVDVLATVTLAPSIQDITLDTDTLYPDGVPVAPGDTIAVKVTAGTYPSTCDVTGRFYSETLTKVYTISGDVEFGKLLPDMTQADFIKDLVMSHALLFKEKDGIVYFKSLQDIISDRANAPDWTRKRVNKKESTIKFSNGEYAQGNFFKYQITDDLLDQDYGQGVITVDDENLELSKSIYDSPFSATFTGVIGYINNVANIPIFDNTSADYYDFVNDPGIRKLLVRINDPATEFNVQYDGSGYADYLVAYFVDPNYDSLLWESFLTDYYSLFEQCLQYMKIVNNQYMLTELDIANFDFFFPVFDSGHYFLVNEIKGFIQSGVKTQVEIFKV